MKLAFVRSEPGNALLPETATSDPQAALKVSAKAGSSSKNIILELLRRGFVSSAEEWCFWPLPNSEAAEPGRIPLKAFRMEGGRLVGLEAEVGAGGPPDILWVEGPKHPDFLAQVFQLCRPSFKLVYSKDWKPWKVERLDQFDLCLVDEEEQAERVRKSEPSVHAGVWDKLVDYETSHFPTGEPKQFDLCYLAYFRPRKNHALLLEAMARLLPDRRVSCALLGGDREDNMALMRRLATDLNVDAHFVGEVGKEEVNSYVCRSRAGVMAAEKDAAPRAILEYLAADVPVLVNADLRAGSRYVSDRCGAVVPPERFHEGIVHVLDAAPSFRPREDYLARFSRDRVFERFTGLLRDAGLTSAAAK